MAKFFAGLALLMALPFAADLASRLAHGMTFWGWITLAAIGLYFLWKPAKSAFRWFWDGLFVGLGVRASGVVGALSRPKREPKPDYQAVKEGEAWRIRAPDGSRIAWCFTSREAAEKLISEIKKAEVMDPNEKPNPHLLAIRLLCAMLPSLGIFRKRRLNP